MGGQTGYFPKILLVIFSAFAMLVISEWGLRLARFKPGFRIQSNYLKKVDSLINRKGFYADSNGISCISQEARELVRRSIAQKNLALPPPNDWHGGTYYLPHSFLELQHNSYRSTFKSFLDSLNSPHDINDIEYISAVKNYALSPINSSGFRSIEFKNYSSSRKSILLLGDSYTWGHSASNITNSFADLLLAKGYVIYNTGIIATDPAQYLQVAKVLVPVFEPDFVVVNFFMGNDIQYFKREPRPYVPVFYCTNAGNLISCPDGIYFNTAKEAYDYSLANFTIPAERSVFNQFCSRFVITTRLWRALDRYRFVDSKIPRYDEYFRQVQEVTLEKPYTNIQLKEIKSITEDHHGKFLLVVIPSPKAKKLIVPKKGEEVFEGLEYHVSPVSKKDYGGHYNDSGHATHADFIDSLVKSEAGKP